MNMENFSEREKPIENTSSFEEAVAAGRWNEAEEWLKK